MFTSLAEIIEKSKLEETTRHGLELIESLLADITDVNEQLTRLEMSRDAESLSEEDEQKILENKSKIISECGERLTTLKTLLSDLDMEKTGLFRLLKNHIINNLFDYVTGVETGLDSNGRKNRGGHIMEDLVESFIKSSGFKRDKDYFKEMTISEIENRWNVDLSVISNTGKTEKRFDFVVKTDSQIYVIETNCYASNVSKLNETARSYKTIT